MVVELKVLVSMMSAPASRYWRWMAWMISGCVRLSRSLFPFRSCGQSLNRSPAKAGLVQLVGLDHGPHRAVENDNALAQQALKLLRPV